MVEQITQLFSTVIFFLDNISVAIILLWNKIILLQEKLC